MSRLFKSGTIWDELDETKKQKIKPADNYVIPEIQDCTKTPVFIGGDVKALYPSMDLSSTQNWCFKQYWTIQYEGINYEFLIVYLRLVLGVDELKKLGLEHAIPDMLDPYDSSSLITNKNRNMKNWVIRNDLLSARDKRWMIAAMIKFAVLILGQSTCYSFGGMLYRQASGAGIGLRGSACLAKICMAKWDQT